MRHWPALMATLTVLVAGYSVMAAGTDGWRVWTAESARRQALLASPRPLPDYVLRDSTGKSLSMRTSGRSLRVVDFVYTQCPTVCLAMGSQFRLLQGELAELDLLGRVELLSITFDPANDDLAELAVYLNRFGAIPPHWRAARFENDTQLEAVLDQFGVIVIPEPTVGFVHNAAFYLIEDNRVSDIYDIDDRAALLRAIRERLGA